MVTSPLPIPFFDQNTVISPSPISSLKKTNFIVDVFLSNTAQDYESQVMKIVSQIAGKNFGQKFDKMESLQEAYLKDAENSKHLLLFFACTVRRANVSMWNKDLSSVAEAVGHQGRVVFEVLKHEEKLTSEMISNDLFKKPGNFPPISEEYQNRIEINTYLRGRTLDEEVSKQMGVDLKMLLDRMNA